MDEIFDLLEPEEQQTHMANNNADKLDNEQQAFFYMADCVLKSINEKFKEGGRHCECFWDKLKTIQLNCPCLYQSVEHLHTRLK